MSAVEGYWKTNKVCEYFDNITPRTLLRWRNRKVNPFPSPIVRSGAEALYPIQAVKSWAASECGKTETSES